MKKRLTSMALALALMASLFIVPAQATNSARFSDVPADHWAFAAVEEMAGLGVVNGVGGDQFDPDGNVTTAQFASMMIRAFFLGDLVADTNTYPAWYGQGMHWALDNQLLLGLKANYAYVAEGSIENWNADVVNTPMTREEMAVVMYNYLKQTIALPSEGQLTAITFYKIPDLKEHRANLFYQMAVACVYELGGLSGVDSKGTFNGSANMTRAQACAVLSRMLKIVDAGDQMNPGAQWVSKVDAKATDWSYLGLAPAGSSAPSQGGNTDTGNTGTSRFAGTKFENLANGKPATAQNITDAIYALKSKYPEGMACSDANFSYDADKSNGYVDATGCAALAYTVLDEIFGKTPYNQMDYKGSMVTEYGGKVKWEDVQVGDIVRQDNQNHWMVVVEKTTDYMVVVEGNVNGKVHWGDKIYKSTAMSPNFDGGLYQFPTN